MDSDHQLRPVAQELGLTSSRFEYKDLSESAEYYINRTKRKDRTGISTYLLNQPLFRFKA